MKLRHAAAALLAAALLAACAPAGPRLRIGLLPDAAALPFLLAEAAGDFARAGLSVELRMYATAAEAGAALAAGELDGCETDLVRAALERAAGGGALVALRCAEPFGLAARGDAGDAGSLGGGAKVGVVPGGADEWALDLLLPVTGAPAKVLYKSEAEVLGALGRGEIDAALLPWPLGFAAVRAGARIVADAEDLGIEPRVFAFAPATPSAPGTRAVFLAALEGARAAMAADPERARPLLGRIGLDGEAAATVPIPAPGRYSAPSAEEVAMAQAWLLRRGLLKSAFSYGELFADAGTSSGAEP